MNTGNQAIGPRQKTPHDQCAPTVGGQIADASEPEQGD
jgi:hypothetical protein